MRSSWSFGDNGDLGGLFDAEWATGVRFEIVTG
jgi:hypothetical protein